MPPTAVPAPPRPRLAWLLNWGWLALPFACHLGFSWMGFNPTDEGWLQAVARRLLAGEVPHRDFIFVRPALSAYLQVPLVWLGGDHTLWLARLWGWLTIGAISWLWSGFRPAPHGRGPMRAIVYAAVFFLTAHSFPVMAWHSLDGLLLCTLAIHLAARGGPGALRLAFVCAGLAALCRQNFAFFPPVLLLAVSTPAKWRAMFWTALAPLLYLGGLLLAGGLGDFLLQMTANQGEFSRVAWGNYLHYPPFLWAIPLGGTAFALLRLAAVRLPGTRDLLPAVATLLLGLFLARMLWLGPLPFHGQACILLGFVLGLALAFAWFHRPVAAEDRLLLVGGIGLSWVIAISIGYNSPAFMTGALYVLALRLIHRTADEAPATTGAGPAALALVTLGVAAAFWSARQTFPYRDFRADRLRYEVGAVLPGGAVLRTNELTYSILADLRRLVLQCETEKHPYAILTDCSVVWIRSPQPNPLPCEWPQETEFGANPVLAARITDAIRRLPPDTRIIVQKVLIAELVLGLYAVQPDSNYYYVQNWVQQQGRKIPGGRFFEVYLPPAAPAPAVKH